MGQGSVPPEVRRTSPTSATMGAMRRFAPLLLLAFALGCGGSGPSGGPLPFLRIAGGRAEELGTGVDAQGGAALVGVAPDGTVRVVTEAGTARFAIPPSVPSAPPRVAGDFVLAPGASGTTILDRRTGTYRFDAGEFPGVSDGSRVAWIADGGLVLEDLATRVRTPILDAASVVAIRGDRMVVDKVVGTKNVEGVPIPVPDYGYFLQPVGGGARVALPAPEGYYDESAAYLGADGSVVGTASALGDPAGNDLGLGLSCSLIPCSGVTRHAPELAIPGA